MSSCGLTNFTSCLPEKFLEFLLSILNSPIEWMLTLIKSLLTEPVNISLFQNLWALNIYIISLFYGLFLIFAGVNFMISGYNVERRENAKQWLKNVILMVLFVQLSYFIYALLVEVSALMTAGVVELIPNSFFLLTTNGMSSLGLQLTILVPYITTLVLTLTLLGLRYLLVSVGVVLLPFAIFFYFILPLRSYAKMIFNVLLITLFITFFDAVILFGASVIMTNTIFSNAGVIMSMVAFITINLVMFFLIVFGIIKAAFSVMNSDVGKTVASAVKYLI